MPLKMLSCVVGLMVASLLAVGESHAPDLVRPNILFCVADDWGWPHAGAYGDEVVQTPTFDRLAREGVLFDHAWISSPSCTPSRNAMLTGQQFYRLGAGAVLWSTLDPGYPNFMYLLRDTGYQIGHWRKAWGPGNFKKGGYDQHPCGPETDFTTFIETRDPSQPFCFWFGTSDPHRDYEKGSGRAAGLRVDDIHVPAFFPDNDEVRSDIADYYFEVQRWDRDVGKALVLLEEQGLLENTIVVMTGDHGMPFPRCKANLYDWGARVPLAIRWEGGIPASRRVTDFVSLTDLAPTFLEAAGIEVPEAMTGRSLLPLLKGGDTRGRDFVVFGRERHVPAQERPSMVGYPARAIRTGKWLLILNLEANRWPVGVPENATHRIGKFADCDGGPTKSAIMALENDPEDRKYYDLCFSKRDAVELYDCETDPDQVNNLADQPGFEGIVEELQTQLVDYLERTGDPRFTDQDVKFDDYPYRP